MEKITYPLLHFELAPDFFLGLLVGTQMNAAGTTPAEVQKKLYEFLRKEYRRKNEYPYMDINKAKLKMLNVPLRPKFRDNTGMYPLSYQVTVPIPVVYGRTDHLGYKCFLPLFKDYFFYQSKDHFEPLSVHLATSYLNAMPQEEVYRLMNLKKPQLDQIELRVKFKLNAGFWKSPPLDLEKQYPTLARLTERFPPRKAIRRKSPTPDAAWELEGIVDQVMELLLQRQSNVLLVGEKGVGKSAVIQQVIRKSKTRSKNQKRAPTFWRLAPQRITSGSRYLGEWEATTEKLVNELEAARGTLWIISMVRLFEIGGEGPEESLANFLSLPLQQGRFQIIAEASVAELDSMRQLLPGLLEQFQVVRIPELEEKAIQKVLSWYAEYVRQTQRLEIKTEALNASYRLLQRYIPYERFPGKAIRFLSQCVTEAVHRNNTQVGEAEVIDFFAEQTGLPQLFLRDDLQLNEAELRQFFGQRIIHQQAAVDQLVQLVKLYKAGLNNPKRPIATLLFAGPTGVGKTASAQALAEYFFGKGQKRSPLIRIDMSEFQHPMQLSNLIGSGREPGRLIKEIRQQPFTVLLLDEIEKAHPSIFDALMTMLDEGLLVDAFGRETHFRNAIVILTSNLGAQKRPPIGFSDTTSTADRYMSAVMQHFRPEFVNRLDQLVIFNKLDPQAILLITRKELRELGKREGIQNRQLQLEYTEDLIKHIARIGFDERYGARPLQKAVEQSIIAPLAKWLLLNPRISKCKIHLDLSSEGHLKISPQS